MRFERIDSLFSWSRPRHFTPNRLRLDPDFDLLRDNSPLPGAAGELRELGQCCCARRVKQARWVSSIRSLKCPGRCPGTPVPHRSIWFHISPNNIPSHGRGWNLSTQNEFLLISRFGVQVPGGVLIGDWKLQIGDWRSADVKAGRSFSCAAISVLQSSIADRQSRRSRAVPGGVLTLTTCTATSFDFRRPL